MSWTADGRGWYVCVRTASGGLLVYADRQGRTSELLESVSMPWVVQSRDGRRVAFPQHTGSSSAWLVRGFSGYRRQGTPNKRRRQAGCDLRDRPLLGWIKLNANCLANHRNPR